MNCRPHISSTMLFEKANISFLDQNNILYNKQFGLSHLIDYRLIQLAGNICNENKYTLGVCIDLSKAFNTVDHSR